MAAWAVEDDAAALTLLRRLTRWLGLEGAKEIEWECCLEDDAGGLEKLPDMGRELGCSFDDAMVEDLYRYSDDSRVQNWRQP